MREVIAVISDVETYDDTDGDQVSYSHRYYGSYTFEGKEYKCEKLKTLYTSSSQFDKK